MAVVGKTKSGLALQVVLSEDLPAGSILQCALSPVVKLSAGGFVKLTILPTPVRPDQFPKSGVLGQTGDVVIPVFNGQSGMSSKRVEEEKERKILLDREVTL